MSKTGEKFQTPASPKAIKSASRADLKTDQDTNQDKKAPLFIKQQGTM